MYCVASYDDGGESYSELWNVVVKCPLANTNDVMDYLSVTDQKCQDVTLLAFNQESFCYLDKLSLEEST